MTSASKWLAMIALWFVLIPSILPRANAKPASTQPAIASTTQSEAVPKGLASPQASMFTFLEAMSQTDSRKPGVAELAWSTALSTMDLSQLPDHALARRRAEQLLAILDRLGEVSRDELPSATDVEGTELSRFRYFPRQPDHAWVWKDLKAFQKAPDGEIVFTRDSNGAWHFSGRSIEGVDTLFQSMKDLPRRYVPQHKAFGLLGATFERTQPVGWIALLVAIFMGLATGRLAQAGLRTLSKRSAAKHHPARAAGFDNAASPTSFFFVTLGLTLGLKLIYLEPDLDTFALRVLQFFYILSVAWLFYNFVDVIEIAIRRITDHTENKVDDMIVPLIRKTLRIFLVVVFTLFIAQNVFGLDITSWLAGLGIAGLAVSLAAQDSIKNLFGSMTVFFDKPFRVGDRITFDNVSGDVEEIGFRSTRIRTLAGHVVTVPNMKLIDNSVENITVRPFIRRDLNVTITYDTPPEKIEEAITILKKILAEPKVAEGFDLENKPPKVAFSDFNADSLNIKVCYWYTMKDDRDFWSYIAHSEVFNMLLLREYNAAKIEFAFPTQTLFLAGDPARKLAVEIEGKREVP